MLKTRFTPAIFCLLILFPAAALAWTGDVVRIADGDTMTVMRQGEQVRVRFYSIDSMAFGFIMCPFPSSADSAQAKLTGSDKSIDIYPEIGYTFIKMYI